MTEDLDSEIRPSRWKETAQDVGTIATLLKILQSPKDKALTTMSAANPQVQKTIKKLQEAKGQEGFTEKDIQVLNKRYMQGHLPRYRKHVVESEESEDDDDEDDDKIKFALFNNSENLGYIKKALNFQVNLLSQAHNYAFKYATKMGYSWFLSLIPANQIYTLTLFLLYTYVLNASFLMVFIPLLLTLASLLVIIISSFRILRGQRRFKEFLAWSDLLLSIDGALDVKKAEDNYFKNHISPVLALPPAIIILIMTFSVESSLITKAPLALLSFGFFVACVWSMNRFDDKLYCVGLGCFLMSTFVGEWDRTSENFDKFALFQFPVPGVNHFLINVSLSGALRLISFVMLTKMPFQKRYRCKRMAFIQYCVPLLVTAMWWDFFTYFFSQSSWSSLGQTVALFFVTVVSLPVAALVFLAASIRAIASLNVMFLVVTILLLVASAWLIKVSKKNFNFTQKLQSLNLGPSLKLLLYILVLVFGLAAYVTIRPSGLEIKESNLLGQEYGTLCLSNPIKSSDKLQQQKLCHELNGHHITNWSGIVKDINILSIENKVESVANVLPYFAAIGLACMYGDHYPEKCDDENTYLCSMAKISHRPCHLQKYNRYKFSVTVQFGKDENFLLQLDASHCYQATLSQLSIGEQVVFSGVLNADTRHVSLKNFNSKDALDMIKVTEKEQSMASIMEDSWKILFRCIFSSLIVAV